MNVDLVYGTVRMSPLKASHPSPYKALSCFRFEQIVLQYFHHLVLVHVL